METQSIYNKLNQIRDEVISMITTKIKEDESGDIHVADNEYYDLPRTFYVDKYGYYNEYAIINARIENDSLIFDGYGLGDGNYGEDIAFHCHEIELFTLIEVLDALNNITEPTK